MGQEILYCFKCRKRLLGSDFDRGHAFQVDRLASCSACLPEFLQSLKPEDREHLQARMAQSSERKKASGPQPAVVSPRKGTERVPLASPRPAARAPGGSALPIAIGVGIVVIVLVFLATRSGPEPLPPTRPTPPVVRPEPPPDSPAARAALQKARQQSKERPDDLAGQIRAWEQAVTAAEKTPLYEEARRELGALMLRRKEALVRDRRDLEEKARPLLAQEQFQAAVDQFQAARSRHELAEWTTAIDQRTREIRASAEEIYRPAKEKARGSADAIRALRERVQKWGIAELIADLPEIPAPPPLPERPWTPLLTRGFDAFRGGGATAAWKLIDGALVRQPTGDDALQTRAIIEDGELRVRFEVNGGSGMFFAVRQGSGEPAYIVSIPTAELRTMKAGPHDLIFVCAGPSVSATLDGQARTVIEGKAKKGSLQFNAEADTGLRILSIDVR